MNTKKKSKPRNPNVARGFTPTTPTISTTTSTTTATTTKMEDERKMQRRQSKQLIKLKSKYNILKQAEIDKLNTELEIKEDPPLEINNKKKINRTIIAEDFNYNLPKVPTLVDLCLVHIIQHFIVHRENFKKLSEKFRKKVTSKLSVDLPIWVTAEVVDDEEYWKKKCRTRWRTSDWKEHGNSWKVTFMEMNVEEAIEQFIPEHSDTNDILEIIEIAGKYIKKLDIKQLLPKQKRKSTSSTNEVIGTTPNQIKDVVVIEDSEGQDIMTKLISAMQIKKPQMAQEESDDDDYERMDFSDILPRLKYLEDLSLQYFVKNCGMDFKWGYFKMSEKDCAALAKSLYFCKSLKHVSMKNSRLDDSNIEILCSQLKDHPRLSSLDLSHNVISDKGMAIISTTLLTKNSFVTLQSIDLTNNNIKTSGAKILANELETNDRLIKLQFRMNKLGDEAGSLILISLAANKTLKFVGLGSCDLGDRSVEALCYVLKNNATLQFIDVSCNIFGTDNGDSIQEAVESNETLLNIDVRETEITKEAEYFINLKCEANQERTNYFDFNEF